MRVLHLSAECYPAAKAGGLGDVVGALPKYLGKQKWPAAAVIPKYHVPWITKRTMELVYTGAYRLGNNYYPFAIEKDPDDSAGFPLYFVNIPGRFDRPGIYGDPQQGWYTDNEERYTAYQLAVLEWVRHMKRRPKVLHCHDHHSGLVPFILQNALGYEDMRDIPTVFTIHNGEYHGAFRWEKYYLLPPFPEAAAGLLDWGGYINPLAAAIKCAWQVTTVSSTYLEELATFSNGLETLIRNEASKALGILNGIDTQVWDPATDGYLPMRLKDNDWPTFKKSNKAALGKAFPLNLNLPMITFIGRLVREKGADMLPELIRNVLNTGLGVSFAILGTGEAYLHEALRRLAYEYPGRLGVVLEYNEGLAHQLYAGADFLLMPSRVEPCGLNQMYAMRYGTIPIVRSAGGLRDTVIDVGDPSGEGRGIRFDHFTVDEAHHAVWRAFDLYHNRPWLEDVRQRITAVDFSWDQSARNYAAIYQQLTK